MSDNSGSEAKHRVSSILHVEVGVPGKWEPTTTELADFVTKFASAADSGKDISVVATRNGVVAKRIPVPDTDAAILHIEAGSSAWLPDPTELKDLKDMFESAITDEGPTAVVATRTDVTAHFIDLSDNASDEFSDFPFDVCAGE